MNKSLENNLRVIVVPLGTLLAAIVIFVLAGNFIFGKITTLLADNDAAQRSKAVLRDKLSSLQSTQGQVSDYAQSLSTALPGDNTALVITSQLKSIAAENSLTLENFAVGPEVKDQSISHVDVTFDASGPSQNIFNFIDETQTLAPINKVERLKLSGAGGGSSTGRGNIVVSSYWASFPTQIPAVSDPLQKITPDEQTMLQALSSLKQPQFLDLTPASGGKADPFSSL